MRRIKKRYKNGTCKVAQVFSSEWGGKTYKICLLPLRYKRPKKESQIDELVPPVGWFVCWFVIRGVVRHTLNISRLYEQDAKSS